MKKTLLTTFAVAVIGSSAFAQGVIFDNNGNSGSISATSNGQVYNQDGTLFDGFNNNLGVAVWTSSDGVSYTLFNVYTPSNDPKGYTGLAPGQFQLGAAGTVVDIPGVTPGANAYFELQVWSGGANGTGPLASDFASAQLAGDPTATVFFAQATGNNGANPPISASNFSSMPSFTLVATPVPEPTTLALAGLGGFGMLMAFRRKKV